MQSKRSLMMHRQQRLPNGRQWGALLLALLLSVMVGKHVVYGQDRPTTLTVNELVKFQQGQGAVPVAANLTLIDLAGDTLDQITVSLSNFVLKSLRSQMLRRRLLLFVAKTRIPTTFWVPMPRRCGPS